MCCRVLWWYACVSLVTNLLVTSVNGSPINQVDGTEDPGDCLDGTTNALDCLSKQANQVMSRAFDQDSLELYPGISLLREGRKSKDRTAVAVSKDPAEDITNRTLSLDLKEIADNIGIGTRKEGRGKKKKKKVAVALIFGAAILAAKALAIATSAAFMIPLAIKGVALLTVTSIAVGTLGVVIASIIGVLRLLDNGEGPKTQVIYTKPSYESHTSQERWDDAQEVPPSLRQQGYVLAYNGKEGPVHLRQELD